jgi:hypothetical protein
VFLKQNDGLIKIYYLKMTKNKTDKTNCCVLAVTRAEKRTRSMFRFTSALWRKRKYVFIENIFGSKDRVEKRKTRGSALLIGKSSSNYMRFCRKHFKKEDYICKLNSILRLSFEIIYIGRLLKAFFCKHNPKFSYLVSTTLVTPHKINNFAHNAFLPFTTHPLSAVASNKLKFCVTLKKAITKTANSRKTNNLFKKNNAQTTRIEREYDLATVAQWRPQRYPKSPIAFFVFY